MIREAITFSAIVLMGCSSSTPQPAPEPTPTETAETPHAEVTASAQASAEPSDTPPAKTEGLSIGFEEGLEPIGCGDVHLFSRSEDGRIGIKFIAEKALASAHGKTNWEKTYTMPSTEVELTIVTGQHVLDGMCSDVKASHQPNIEHTYKATKGTAKLSLTSGKEPDATLTLKGVEFRDEADHAVSLPSYALKNIHVGWNPG